MIVWKRYTPANARPSCRQSLTQSVIDRDSWRNLRKRNRTDRLFSYALRLCHRMAGPHSP
jgi:hypothetical protein